MINWFTSNCAELVTESKGLSEQQKEFLREHIINFPQPEILEISFDFNDLGKSEWRFLFWHGREFNAKTCADNMQTVLKENITLISNSYLDNVQNMMNKWYDSFISALESRIADFNPTLQELVRQQEACSQEIQHLEDLNTRFTQNQEEIRRLFELDNEEV